MTVSAEEIVHDLMLSFMANGGAIPAWYVELVEELDDDTRAEVVRLLEARKK